MSLHHRNHPVCKVLGEGTVHIGKEIGHVENNKVGHLRDRCPVTVIQLVERLHNRHTHLSSRCIAQQFFGHYLHRRRHVDTRVVNLRKLAEQLFCKRNVSSHNNTTKIAISCQNNDTKARNHAYIHTWTKEGAKREIRSQKFPIHQYIQIGKPDQDRQRARVYIPVCYGNLGQFPKVAVLHSKSGSFAKRYSGSA